MVTYTAVRVCGLSLPQIDSLYLKIDVAADVLLTTFSTRRCITNPKHNQGPHKSQPEVLKGLRTPILCNFRRAGRLRKHSCNLSRARRFCFVVDCFFAFGVEVGL